MKSGSVIAITVIIGILLLIRGAVNIRSAFALVVFLFVGIIYPPAGIAIGAVVLFLEFFKFNSVYFGWFNSKLGNGGTTKNG